MKLSALVKALARPSQTAPSFLATPPRPSSLAPSGNVAVDVEHHAAFHEAASAVRRNPPQQHSSTQVPSICSVSRAPPSTPASRRSHCDPGSDPCRDVERKPCSSPSPSATLLTCLEGTARLRKSPSPLSNRQGLQDPRSRESLSASEVLSSEHLVRNAASRVCVDRGMQTIEAGSAQGGSSVVSTWNHGDQRRGGRREATTGSGRQSAQRSTSCAEQIRLRGLGLLVQEHLWRGLNVEVRCPPPVLSPATPQVGDTLGVCRLGREVLLVPSPSPGSLPCTSPRNLPDGADCLRSSSARASRSLSVPGRRFGLGFVPLARNSSCSTLCPSSRSSRDSTSPGEVLDGAIEKARLPRLHHFHRASGPPTRITHLAQALVHCRSLQAVATGVKEANTGACEVGCKAQWSRGVYDSGIRAFTCSPPPSLQVCLGICGREGMVRSVCDSSVSPPNSHGDQGHDGCVALVRASAVPTYNTGDRADNRRFIVGLVGVPVKSTRDGCAVRSSSPSALARQGEESPTAALVQRGDGLPPTATPGMEAGQGTATFCESFRPSLRLGPVSGTPRRPALYATGVSYSVLGTSSLCSSPLPEKPRRSVGQHHGSGGSSSWNFEISADRSHRFADALHHGSSPDPPRRCDPHPRSGQHLRGRGLEGLATPTRSPRVALRREGPPPVFDASLLAAAPDRRFCDGAEFKVSPILVASPGSPLGRNGRDGSALDGPQSSSTLRSEWQAES